MTNKAEDKDVIREDLDIPTDELSDEMLAERKADNEDVIEEKSNDREAHKENPDNLESMESNSNDEEEPQDSKESDDENKFIRLMADFQNYKKRAEKEKSDIYAWANEKIMTDLLGVLDNFERALEHDSNDEKYVEGMRLIFKQLSDALTSAGLREIKAEGKTFDPNFHNAVMTCDDDAYEKGTVVEVYQKGYTLNGKLLRASMVKVNN